MSNVINIDHMRPHRTGTLQCGHCNHSWVGVWPEIAKAFECPQCNVWINEYGTPVSLHTCKTCGHTFSVCPPSVDDGVWGHCLADDCASYDPGRDATIFDFRRDDDE